jgi:hypothetical protein
MYFLLSQFNIKTEDIHIDLDQFVVPKCFQDTYFYLLDVTNLNRVVVLCVLEANLCSLTMRAIKITCIYKMESYLSPHLNKWIQLDSCHDVSDN